MRAQTLTLRASKNGSLRVDQQSHRNAPAAPSSNAFGDFDHYKPPAAPPSNAFDAFDSPYGS